jgi:hypothetical protein
MRLAGGQVRLDVRLTLRVTDQKRLSIASAYLTLHSPQQMSSELQFLIQKTYHPFLCLPKRPFIQRECVFILGISCHLIFCLELNRVFCVPTIHYC